MRRKIDFLIIGAQKSGTTTLYNWLKQHPHVFLPETKEVLYFARDEFYRQGGTYLDVFYRHYAGQPVVGGAYVRLMCTPQVVERINKYNPEMKCIAVLRNPIDRAYSAFWFSRQNGWEDCPSFEDALSREKAEKEEVCKYQSELTTYLAHGHYYEQLKGYFDVFPDSTRVLLTQDLKDNPCNSMKAVLSFLGLPENVDMLDLSQNSNLASSSRIRWLNRMLLSYDSWYKRMGRAVLPAAFRDWWRHGISEKIILYNRKPFQYPPMNAGTRKELVEYFAPHNAKLEKLIGRDLSIWNK